MKPEEVLEEIVGLAGRRSRVDGLDALNAFLKRKTYSTVGDAREAFATALYVLKSAGRVRLPTGKHLWDYGTRVPIPKWITVVRESRPAAAWSHLGHPWHPVLGFVADLTSLPNVEDLLALDRWLRAAPPDEPLVPIKERSWEIFGHEKKLEALVATRLFEPGRLTLDSLRCYIVEHVPVHRVYLDAKPVLIISENEAGFDSLCRASAEFRAFKCVVFGNGLAVEKAVAFLASFVAEHRIERCVYVGDVDAAGLAIPQRLNQALSVAAGVAVVPWLPGYEHMLRGIEDSPLAKAGADCWLPPMLRERAHALFRADKRVAQESIGWKQIHALLAGSR